MAYTVLVILVGVTCAVLCQPVHDTKEGTAKEILSDHLHNVERRFINPMFNLGGSYNLGSAKLRTKRSEEQCEKLALCKLHARSRQNFFAAYELYFVNKENARYWDHHARSISECEERFGDCYDK